MNLTRVSFIAFAGFFALSNTSCSTRIGDSQGVTVAGKPCSSDRDCPVPANACQVWTCFEERCRPVAAAKDTMIPNESQVPGDCKLLVCDGQGQASALADKSDTPPEDDNPCAEEVCEEGEPAYPPVEVGTRCGKSGVCNGRGKCGVCLPDDKRCRGNTPELCSEEGQWEGQGACAPGQPICNGTDCIGILTVQAGDEFSCGILADGTVRCFGNNSFGEAAGTATRVTGLSKVMQLALGEAHSCAMGIDQTVKCWGDNTFGQLGNSEGGSRGSPVLVSGLTEVRQIATGRDFTCAKLPGGTVTCFGNNEDGQLGTTPVKRKLPNSAVVRGQTVQDRPVEIKRLAKAEQISLGGRHACAMTSDRTVACWGANDKGQLGSGPEEPAPKADKATKMTPIKGLKDVVVVAAGGRHACALLQNRSVMCWGNNDHGQLGDGTTKKKTGPVAVKGLDSAMFIQLGENASCALTVEGNVVCWGNVPVAPGSTGTDVTSPSPIGDLSSVLSLSVGGNHACAGLSDQTFVCWGGNQSGELGSGSTGEKPAPVIW
ncbi:MAG: hypothetical protein IPK82_03050 [Polyangiaceae bacterium]|nr:hypothetical protein [Polyangiaceae bacterium]